MKCERKCITQPPDHWAAFQEAASKAGMTLSAWMSEKCRVQLPLKVRHQLADRPSTGRPRNETK
jgi:hypothetical protein